MSGISPNYADWRQLSAIPIWKIASLIQGFDPRAVEAGDVAVQDPFEPSSPYGVGPDFSWEVEVLITAVQTGHLVAVTGNTIDPNKISKVTTASLVPWLRLQGYADLANQLKTSPQANGPAPPTDVVPVESTVTEPERRLQALRALGGEAKWLKMKWRFTKIVELTAQEKRSKMPRCDEKTIRKDLSHAAQAESMARHSGSAP